MSRKTLIVVTMLALLALPMLLLLGLSVFPNQWLIDKIEDSVFESTGIEASINKLNLDLLQTSPEVRGNGVSLRFPETGTTISGITFLADFPLIAFITGDLQPGSISLAGSEGSVSIPKVDTESDENPEIEHAYSLDAVVRFNAQTRNILLKGLILGPNHLQGDLQINVATSPATVVGDLESSNLDLDTLSDIQAALTRISDNGKDQNRTADRYFSPVPLNLDPLVRQLAGAVHYRIKSAKYRNLKINSLTINLSADGETSLLTIDSDDFIEGKLSTKMALSMVSDLPRLQVETEIQLLSIGELFSVLGDENTAAGKISGKGKYWLSGRSAASLAASANGGMFLLIDRGELDAMLVELAGLDVTETLSLLFKKTIKSTKVNCGYIDIKTKNGLSTLADFVMDTEDTVFTGSGTVNFNSQSIDVTIKPLPRDAGFLAAPTALKIGGSLLQPKIRPAKTLLTRLATAAALATFATPAAVLVPFIEIGNDKSGEGCAGYVKTVK